MIIDGHVHAKAADRYRREFSAQQILQAMDEAGVDQSVVFAVGLPSRESNDLMCAVCDAAPERLIPFAHIVPSEGIVASLEMTRALSKLRCRGVKVHLGEMAEVDAEQMVMVSRRCAEARVPLLIDIAGRLDIAALLAHETPDCNLIIAHLGSASDEELVDKTIALAYEHASIHLDTSSLSVPWKLVDALAAVGPGKLVWGSNGPLLHPAIELQKLRVLGLSDADFEMITSGTLLRLTSEQR